MAKKSEKIKVQKKGSTQSFFQRNIFELIIVAFCFLIYSNSLLNGYNMDDELVTRNHRLTSKGISAIPEIFTSPYYQDESGYAYEYRPVVLATFAIEHSLLGDNPFVSHLFNLLLYAFCCVLLYRVLRSVSSAFTPVFLLAITLLFAAHPSHTEVVSSIKNRDEILGLIFCLLSLVVAFKAVYHKRKNLLLFLPVVFALALMNKITFLSFAIIIPFALLLFTEINFLSLLSTSVLLALPAFFLLNINSLYLKVEIVVGLISSSVLLFVFLRSHKTVQQLKSVYQSVFNSNKQSSNSIPELEGCKDFFKNSIPPPEYFKPMPIIVSIVLLLIFLGGFYNGLSIASGLVAIVLLALIFKGTSKWSWWANVILNIGFLTIILCKPIVDEFLLYYSLLTIWFSFSLLFAGNDLRLLNLLSLTFISIPIFVSNMMGILVYPFFLVGVRLKKTRLLTVLIALMFAIISFVDFLRFPQHTPPSLSVFPTESIFITWAADYVYFTFVFLLAAIFFKKFANVFAWAYLLIALVVVLTLGAGNQITNPGQVARINIEDIGTRVNTNVLTAKQDRPINFVEEPVDWKDPWQIKAGTSLHVLFHYFVQTIIPYPLAFYYGYKFISPEKITQPIPVLSILVHLCLLLIAIYFLKHDKIISFAIGIYLISMVPFSGYILQIPGIVADRYLLIPSIGWSTLLSTLLLKIAKTKEAGNSKEVSTISLFMFPKTFTYPLIGILCCYSAITFSRNFDWKDDLTLMRNDIKHVPTSSQAHNLLAVHLMKKSFEVTDPIEQTKLQNEALDHFKSAIEIYPLFYNVAFDLGRTYATLNIPDSAIVYFKRAVEIDSTNSDAHLFIAKLLVERARNEEAIPFFEYRINHAASDYSSYESLSFLYFSIKNYDRSIAVNKEAIRQFPGTVDPLLNIGRTFFAMAKQDSARFYFQQVLLQNPNNTAALQLLDQLSK